MKKDLEALELEKRLLAFYRDMVRIRTFEKKVVDDCFPRGLVYGNFHTCIGQEADVVGAVHALSPGDFLTTTHRGHGHCIAKGMDTKRMMAELFGKETGYCRGRGGSLHVADLSLGILGANGIVGGGIPIATGSALATKIGGGKEVTACFFGEGASNEGTFHESLNMAAAWKLPVVYICENNLWAVGTPASAVLNTDGIAVRANAYGIPGVTADGNDVCAVYACVKTAVQRARSGEGPTLVELCTFRMRAHNSAVKEIRPDSLLKEWEARDPIALLRARLCQDEVSPETLSKLEREAAEEMEEACRFAEASPYPNPASLCENVYRADNERCTVR